MNHMHMTGVVTGANGGIGSAVARQLAKAGHVIIAQHHPRFTAQAEELQAELRTNGTEVLLVSADFLEHDGVQQFTSEVTGIMEDRSDLRLKVLVNTAALLAGPSHDSATAEQFDAFFNVNVRAPFFICQALAPLMPTGGSIVNVSSAAAHFSTPDDIVYAMGKAAIEQMTRQLAEPYAKRGVRVNAVIPGFTNNGMQAFDDPDFMAYMSSFAILGGVAAPHEIAEAICFLASDRASRTTGSMLDATGGSILGVRGVPEEALGDRLAGLVD